MDRERLRRDIEEDELNGHIEVTDHQRQPIDEEDDEDVYKFIKEDNEDLQGFDGDEEEGEDEGQDAEEAYRHMLQHQGSASLQTNLEVIHEKPLYEDQDNQLQELADQLGEGGDFDEEYERHLQEDFLRKRQEEMMAVA